MENDDIQKSREHKKRKSAKEREKEKDLRLDRVRGWSTYGVKELP